MVMIRFHCISMYLQAATWRYSSDKSRESNRSHDPNRQGSRGYASAPCKDTTTALLGGDLIKSTTPSHLKRRESDRERRVSFECDAATELAPLKHAIVDDEGISGYRS